MARGVHVFNVIQELHIQHEWVRSVLGVSEDRYFRLRRDKVLFTQKEVRELAKAFRHTYGIDSRRLFDRDAEILPKGRVRRAKGTVTRPPEGSAA